MLSCDSRKFPRRLSKRLGRIIADRTEAMPLQNHDVPVVGGHDALEATGVFGKPPARYRHDARASGLRRMDAERRYQLPVVLMNAVVVVGEAVTDKQNFRWVLGIEASTRVAIILPARNGHFVDTATGFVFCIRDRSMR